MVTMLLRLVVCLVTVSICASANVCPRGCACPIDSHRVICIKAGLTSIPRIQLDAGSQYITLDLSDNNITDIPNDSFKNMPFKEIVLKNSNVKTIASNAFSGSINRSLVKLDLSDNQLTELPTALSQLNYLTTLDIRNNPIKNADDFTTFVMRAIGDTIRTFLFGSRDLAEWPTNLNHFQQLNSLTVDHLSSRISLMPPTSFHGFETTLRSLTITNTDLIAVPLGISRLKHLTSLHFDNNPNVGDRGILIQSFPLSFSPQELTNLTLNGNSLTQFPTVIWYLTNLKNLSLDNNAMNFYSDSVDRNYKISVTNLYLRNCSISRIPGDLAELPHLQYLDLSNNDIDSIYENDLQGMNTLNTLVMSNCSLNFISVDALRNLTRLQNFDFSHTSLTEVPRALGNKCFNQINLKGDTIDCMCETLLWLQNTPQRPSTRCPSKVVGDCDTIYSSIKHYIDTYIPECPQYKLEHHLPPYDS